MTVDLTQLQRLVGMSLSRPRQVAEALNDMRITRDILWTMLLLVVILRVITLSIKLQLQPDLAAALPMTLLPFGMTVATAAVMVVLVFAIYFGGQMLGGTGRFPGALLMMIWLQGMAFAFQAVEIATSLIFPVLSLIVAVAGMGWALAAIIIAIDVLHGFRNLFKAAAVLIIATLGPIVGLSFILTLIGVTAQGGAI